MLDLDGSKRPTIDQVLASPWLSWSDATILCNGDTYPAPMPSLFNIALKSLRNQIYPPDRSDFDDEGNKIDADYLKIREQQDPMNNVIDINKTVEPRPQDDPEKDDSFDHRKCKQIIDKLKKLVEDPKVS